MLHAWIDPGACVSMSAILAASIAIAEGADRVVLRARALSPDAQRRLADDLGALDLPSRSVLWAGDPEVLAGIPTWCAGAHLAANMIGRIDDVRARGYEVVGCSVHNRDELQRAHGADLVTVSPVFAPRSKPPGGTVLGLEGLAELVRAAAMPAIALGGVTPDRVAAVAGTGVAGVAALSPFGRVDRSEARELIRAVAAARWARTVQ